MNKRKEYVIITPAKNEEKTIENTIISVISQTFLPKKWIIVNDGSTDYTYDIIEKYSKKYNFINIVNILSEGKRNFASKANAFYAGYKKLKRISYNYIGNLDADVSFNKKYYQNILKKFEENEKLGLAGGIILEKKEKKYYPQKISLNSVAGAIQLFKRECFEKIGGYLQIEIGGIDAAAEIMVRMYGWKVKTFPDLKVLHHRRVGVTKKRYLEEKFIEGKRFYLLGYHPIFFILRCVYRAIEKPYFIGSIARLLGYFSTNIKKPDRPVSEKFVEFIREEQINRLKRI